MARYRRRLRDWESERERQINEFTITEKDLVPDKTRRVKSTGDAGKKRGKPTLGKSADNFLKINKVKEQENLYKGQPKDKTYKPYKVMVYFIFDVFFFFKKMYF